MHNYAFGSLIDFRNNSPHIAVHAASKVDDSKGPVFLKEPTNRIDFSNSTGAVVECSATGNPPPEMIWIRSDGTAVGEVPGLRQILPNGNLVFPPFRAEDYRQDVHAQVYACMAKNQFGSIISRDVNVRAGKLCLGPTHMLREPKRKERDTKHLRNATKAKDRIKQEWGKVLRRM